MLVLLIIFTTITELPVKITCNVTSSYPESTKRDWVSHGLFRRFAFPPGTFIIFTPEITVPAWRNYDKTYKRKSGNRKFEDHPVCDDDSMKSFSKEGGDQEDVAAFKNSAVQISSPFYVYFDKLGWTHADSIYNTPHNAASYIQEYLVEPALHIFGVPPPSTKMDHKKKANIQNRGGSIFSNSKREASLSEIHRLQLFRKIESLLEEIGAENGKACLLRAICELNESPFDKGTFGIFGEVLVLLLGYLLLACLGRWNPVSACTFTQKLKKMEKPGTVEDIPNTASIPYFSDIDKMRKLYGVT